MQPTMTKQELLNRLDELKRNAEAWSYDRDRGRYALTVDDYTLHVDKMGDHCVWMVEHTRYGVLVAWTPRSVVAWAKNEAIHFTRAHVLGVLEDQHAQ